VDASGVHVCVLGRAERHAKGGAAVVKALRWYVEDHLVDECQDVRAGFSPRQVAGPFPEFDAAEAFIHKLLDLVATGRTAHMDYIGDGLVIVSRRVSIHRAKVAP